MFVSKTVRLIIAAASWCAVGLHLLHLGMNRLLSVKDPGSLISIGICIPIVVLLYRYVFRNLVDRNVTRIDAGPLNALFLHFIPLRTYLLIVVMMLFGLVLRHTGVPEMVRATVYLSMGPVLLMSGFRYVWIVFYRIRSRN